MFLPCGAGIKNNLLANTRVTRYAARAHPHGVWHAGISWWSIKMWLRCCLREVNILVIALSQTAPLPPDGYSTFASRLVHASTHQHELHDEKEITAVNPAPAQTRPVQGQSHLQGKSHM